MRNVFSVLSALINSSLIEVIQKVGRTGVPTCPVSEYETNGTGTEKDFFPTTVRAFFPAPSKGLRTMQRNRHHVNYQHVFKQILSLLLRQKRISVLLPLLALLMVSNFTLAQLPLLESYPVMDSVIRYPVRQESLMVLCKKKISERHITFVGVRGMDNVLLVAVTLEPIANVNKDISLTVQFTGINPKPGKVETWGYVYDRNHDGKIDYLSLLGGAAPFWANDVPEYFPGRGVAMDMDQMEMFVSHSDLVFNHWADDNYDGKLDGVIHVDMFEERDWVKRRLMVRSSKFNDEYDDITSFRKRPGDLEDTIEVNESGVPYIPIGKPKEEINKKMFEEKTAILDLLNKAVVSCNLSKKLRGVPITKREEQ
ncbi:MAG: hypothetical protein HYZ34_05850 [Ignavibacteriae bacterium]|nr:hypothetical protein [Ignavibacteriota bacterium]